MTTNADRDYVVMTNRFPWNDLVLDGLGWKQGAQNIKHRGLVLLRNSKCRVDRLAMDERDDAVPPLTKEVRGAIVGAAELVDVEGEFGDGLWPGLRQGYIYKFGRTWRFKRPVPLVQLGPVRWSRVRAGARLKREMVAAGVPA